MFYGEKLPALLPGRGVAAASQPPRVVARGPPSLLRQRCCGQPGSVGDGRGVRYGEARAAALQPMHDDQSVGVRLLYRGLQFAADRAKVGGGHRVPSAGGGKPTELPDDIGFQKGPSAGPRRVIRTGVEDRFGSWGDEGGEGSGGRNEKKGQREQTQSDEPRPDGGEGKTTERRSATVAGTSRECGYRRRRPSRQGPEGRRTAGGTGAARDTAEENSGSEAGAGGKGTREGGGGRQRSERGEGERERPVQLHRSGIAHDERRRRLCAGLQRASSGGAGLAADRGAGCDAGHQRQKAVDADGGNDRRAEWAKAGRDLGRQRILFGKEPGGAGVGGSTRAEDRRLYRHGTDEAQRIQGTLCAGTAAEGRNASRPHAAETEDQSGEGSVCSSEGDRGAGVRADQARARVPAVSVAGHRESAGRVVTGVRDTQHLEAVPPLHRIGDEAEMLRRVGNELGNGIGGPL